MKSSCIITFEGLNISRLLNTLCQRNVAVFKVVRQGKTCVLQVSSRQSGKVVALLKEKCYNIKEIRYIGASGFLRFVKKRFIIPVAVIVSFAALFIASQFCFKIEVQGDFDKNSVYAALSNAGVSIGSNLSRMDVDYVENAVANSLDAMYAVVSRKGSVVYVNVIAKKLIEPPIDMNKRRDIVAKYSGVVTSILCEQGYAKVKVGDFVNVGDVLIEGRRVFNDGESRDVYALGKVVVKRSVSGFAEFNGQKTVYVETGKYFTSTGVVLFGKEYSTKCPFENYTLTTKHTGLFPLNLEITKNYYSETQRVTVNATLEECMEDLKSSAYELAEKDCDFKVIEVKYEVKDGGVTAILYGEYEHY